MEQLIFGSIENQRFTQDSPVLPEVWMKYAHHPDKAYDLILIPHRNCNAGAFAKELNQRLQAYRANLPERLKDVDILDNTAKLTKASRSSKRTATSRKPANRPKRKRARIAHLPGVVAARLYFDEFLRLVLPATPWWQQMIGDYRARLFESESPEGGKKSSKTKEAKTSGTKRDLRLSPYRNFGAPDACFSLEKAKEKTGSGLSLVEKLAQDMVVVESLSQASINETRDYSRPRAAFIHNARIAGAIATLFLGGSLPEIKDGHFRPRNRKEMTEVGKQPDDEDARKKKGNKDDSDDTDEDSYNDELYRVAYDHVDIARNFLTMFDKWPGPQCPEKEGAGKQKKKKISAPSPDQIWQVSMNRNAIASVERSTLACKADAARLLFNVDCKNVIWAVADSGINAHHPAFFDWRGDTGQTRVLKTYDFRELRESLSLDRDKGDKNLKELIKNRIEEGVLASMAEGDEEDMPDTILENKVEEMLVELDKRLNRGADVDWTLLEPIVAVDEKFVEPPKSDHGAHVAGILAADWPINPMTEEPVRPEEVLRLRKLKLALDDKVEKKREEKADLTEDEKKARAVEKKRKRLADDMLDAIKEEDAGESPVVRAAGTTVSWHEKVDKPQGKEKRKLRDKIDKLAVIHSESRRHMTGMCPDIRLYDFRVLRDDGQSDEFEVIAALQFIRFLNARAGATVVHGVNLSLSIPHKVVNYACGNTPVCEECNQLSANGTVVVAAAGNQGHSSGAAGFGGSAYNDISITDPGNAEGVITVGATHCYKPHVYGPSYFSSRGPTGDGRLKPDLVAPGEKITAPVGLDDEARKDGTSMAAPHVSGAAAILMARHVELIGQPAKIKKILCETATDLGRERYFQGAGMLDVLRALQSV